MSILIRYRKRGKDNVLLIPKCFKSDVTRSYLSLVVEQVDSGGLHFVLCYSNYSNPEVVRFRYRGRELARGFSNDNKNILPFTWSDYQLCSFLTGVIFGHLCSQPDFRLRVVLFFSVVIFSFHMYGVVSFS